MYYKKRFIKGYSLLELAVVLVIIAVVAGSGITLGLQQVENAKRIQTNNKIAFIQEALMAYRTQNDRIPCPTDGAVLPTDADYGIEGANPGSCIGGIPSANFSNLTGNVYMSSGAVPFKTLNLPEEFMYDGWGNKLTYTVNNSFTAAKSFSATPLSEDCGGLSVREPTGTNNRTTGAVYVLVSHGKNGHGAYTRNGIRQNTGATSLQSTNVDELQNCDCSTAVASTGLNGIYVQKPPTEDATNPNNSFDDIVSYKSRWQMQTGQDPVTPPYTGPAFTRHVVAGLEVYSRVCGTFTLTTTVAPKPFAFPNGNSMAATPDGTYLEWGGYFYKRSGSTYVRTTDPSPIPATPTSSDGAVFSPNTNYLVYALSAAPWVRVYKRDGDSLTELPGAITGTAEPEAPSWSANSVFLALSSTGVNAPRIFKRSGDNFTELPTPTPLPTPVTGGMFVALSPDAQYMSLAGRMTAAPHLHLYKRDPATDQFNRVATVNFAGAWAARSSNWSSDGRYLAVYWSVGAGFNRLAVYRRDGDTLVDTTTGPPFNAASNQILHARYFLNSTYLAVCSVGSVYNTTTSAWIIFKRAGEHYTQAGYLDVTGVGCNTTSNSTFIE